MKTKRKAITKKEIASVLRSMDTTKIFRAAKLYGLDVSDKMNVFKFIEEFAPSEKVRRRSFDLSCRAGDFKHFRCGVYRHRSKITPIEQAIRHAKAEKKIKNTSYFKVLMEGFNNIYWCSPAYGHRDYNKSIAFPNTEKNRAIMNVINRYLLK